MWSKIRRQISKVPTSNASTKIMTALSRMRSWLKQAISLLKSASAIWETSKWSKAVVTILRYTLANQSAVLTILISWFRKRAMRPRLRRSSLKSASNCSARSAASLSFCASSINGAVSRASRDPRGRCLPWEVASSRSLTTALAITTSRSTIQSHQTRNQLQA